MYYAYECKQIWTAIRLKFPIEARLKEQNSSWNSVNLTARDYKKWEERFKTSKYEYRAIVKSKQFIKAWFHKDDNRSARNPHI